MSTDAAAPAASSPTSDFMMALLQQTALQLNTQALANHQTVQHLADLAWLDKLTSMDIAESFATQGLQHASVGRDAVAGTIAGGGFPANARGGQAQPAPAAPAAK